jgi:3-oxoacyl-(acyl-carrier-protein) synthase
MMNTIVCTGWAAITARGDFSSDAPQVLASLSSDLGGEDFGGGPIAEFALGKYLGSTKTYLDRCSALALAGAAGALKAAGVAWPAEDGDEFGVALGTHDGCLETMRGFWQNAQERGVEKANSILFSHSYLNSPISLCAIEFGLRGYHGTFSHDAYSGSLAMRAAFDALRLGHAQAMLCGGADALTPTRQSCEPSSSASEAAVFAILETTEHAEQRGAQVVFTVRDSFDALDIERARAVFGDCAGATGALAWLLQNAEGAGPRLVFEMSGA